MRQLIYGSFRMLSLTQLVRHKVSAHIAGSHSKITGRNIRRKWCTVRQHVFTCRSAGSSPLWAAMATRSDLADSNISEYITEQEYLNILHIIRRSQALSENIGPHSTSTVSHITAFITLHCWVGSGTSYPWVELLLAIAPLEVKKIILVKLF